MFHWIMNSPFWLKLRRFVGETYIHNSIAIRQVFKKWMDVYFHSSNSVKFTELNKLVQCTKVGPAFSHFNIPQN